MSDKFLIHSVDARQNFCSMDRHLPKFHSYTSVRFSDIKHMWLLRDLTSDQARTTLKPLHQLCVKPLCALCWLWLQLRTWNYALWIYPMHSPIVILMQKFTWNSQRDLSKVEKNMSVG